MPAITSSVSCGWTKDDHDDKGLGTMASDAARLLRFLNLAFWNQFSPQQLGRTPEPEQVMDKSDNVASYERAAETQLSLAYAVGLDLVHRYRSNIDQCGQVLDLACGTGVFTRALATLLPSTNVTGIDLSRPMVDAATKHANNFDISNLRFVQGDITHLSHVPTDSVEICCFNQAAHHMSDLATVSSVVAEMDRVTRPDGVVLITDLVRLRTHRITDSYVQTMTWDYSERGLDPIARDFRNSMYAAWTMEELQNTLPKNDKRNWHCHSPIPLPTMWAAVGGIRKRRRRLSLPSLVPRRYLMEARLLQHTIRTRHIV